jgi:hypothetical protein
VDIGAVVAAVVPYLSALAGAYGHAVIEKVSDESADAAADATVGIGRRILRRLLAIPHAGQAIGAAVTDLAEHPDDEDFTAGVRAQVKKAIAADPALLAEIAQLLADAEADPGKYRVAVSGSQGVQIGDHNTQANTFGVQPP